MELKEITGKFAIKGSVTAVEPLGSGLINDTYRVMTDTPDSYVLQRINHHIFKDVELLQSNIEAVTSHLRAKGAKTLTFVPLRDERKTFFFDGENYWRISLYVSGSHTCDAVTPESSYDAGRSFGEFEAMLADIPVTLGETIPDFHNMELRLQQLKEAVADDRAERMKKPEVKELVDKMLALEDDMCLAERLYREGKLPKHVCHCDTKVNNMLFDDEGKVICVIDLDTVMPGFVFSDYGDFLRTAANTGAEDDTELGRVGFNMEIFRCFTRGFIEATASFLSPLEKENLPYGAQRFAFMQAVRFLADYINGDTYYKVRYPEHNLVRTKAQWRLFESITEHLGEMKQYIASL